MKTLNTHAPLIRGVRSDRNWGINETYSWLRGEKSDRTPPYYLAPRSPLTPLNKGGTRALTLPIFSRNSLTLLLVCASFTSSIVLNLQIPALHTMFATNSYFYFWHTQVRPEWMDNSLWTPGEPQTNTCGFVFSSFFPIHKSTIAILNDLLIVREQDARTVRVLPSIEFATDLGLLYKQRQQWHYQLTGTTAFISGPTKVLGKLSRCLFAPTRNS